MDPIIDFLGFNIVLKYDKKSGTISQFFGTTFQAFWDASCILV